MNKLPQLSYLEWDSSFFGLDVFRFACTSSSNSIGASLRKISCKNKLLIYFQSSDFFFRQHSCYRSGLKITYEGKKMIYTKDLSGSINSSPFSVPLVDHRLSDSNYQQLFDLSLDAGQFSRFRKDLGVPYSVFLNLYHQWITKSVARIMADEIFVRYLDGLIVGFASVKKTSDIAAEICLIAVNVGYRGLGVGRDLIKAVQLWCTFNSIHRLSVITQGDNLQARSFYLNCGFSISEVAYLSHLRWTNKTPLVMPY